MGCWGYAKLLIKQKKFCLSNKEKLFLKAEDQIIKEFDILNIVRKLHEINKLKQLFLNDEQMFLFNLLSKPMIVLDKKDQKEGNLLKIEDYIFKYPVGNNKNLEKDKILKIYKEIKKKVETNSGSEIDKKIIKLLDEDVRKYLNHEQYD